MLGAVVRNNEERPPIAPRGPHAPVDADSNRGPTVSQPTNRLPQVLLLHMGVPLGHHQRRVPGELLDDRGWRAPLEERGHEPVAEGVNPPAGGADAALGPLEHMPEPELPPRLASARGQVGRGRRLPACPGGLHERQEGSCDGYCPVVPGLRPPLLPAAAGPPDGQHLPLEVDVADPKPWWATRSTAWSGTAAENCEMSDSRDFAGRAN